MTDQSINGKLSAPAQAIWKLLWEYIANEDSTEDYSAEMAERLCECVLPLVWSEVATLEAVVKRLGEAVIYAKALCYKHGTGDDACHCDFYNAALGDGK